MKRKWWIGRWYGWCFEHFLCLFTCGFNYIDSFFMDDKRVYKLARFWHELEFVDWVQKKKPSKLQRIHTNTYTAHKMPTSKRFAHENILRARRRHYMMQINVVIWYRSHSRNVSGIRSSSNRTGATDVYPTMTTTSMPCSRLHAIGIGNSDAYLVITFSNDIEWVCSTLCMFTTYTTHKTVICDCLFSKHAHSLTQSLTHSQACSVSITQFRKGRRAWFVSSEKITNRFIDHYLNSLWAAFYDRIVVIVGHKNNNEQNKQIRTRTGARIFAYLRYACNILEKRNRRKTNNTNWRLYF